MKKAYKFILMFLPIFSLCQNKNDSKNIEYIIQIFKNNNIDKISEIIDYPLKREYPIPVVKNKNDFKTRFNTIFDKNLIHIISNSKVTDWNEVGWRGIMLDNGIIWIDTDGKIIAINYQSDSEKKLLEDLIKNEKQELYIAIRNFAKPVYKIQTKSYLIRIDELKNGSYRYVSWKRGSFGIFKT